MKDKIDIQIAIQNLKARIGEASSQFRDWIMTGEQWYNPSWSIESCFLQLLIITEILSLPELRNMIHEEYIEVKKSKNSFNESDVDPDGDPYPVVTGRLRCYLIALENLYPDMKHTTVTKDLLQIIRDIHYVITDTAVFQNTPSNENDVHIRIEAVLKCVFPDLKHKPVLMKQIKNFTPDTGIPSLQTLVEYKYLARKSDIGLIADQLLADTRGYTSKDWTRFLYVIYETNRFRTEKDWVTFLREAGVSENTSVVVLGGEPATSRKVIPNKNTKNVKDKPPNKHKSS
jgi:hypothetical protein